MNNLKLSWELPAKLELQSEDEVVQFSAFDVERNRLFFSSSANFIYTTQLPSSQEATWASNSFSVAVEPIDLEPGDYITSLDYLMEKEALIVGTSYGLLLLYNVDDNVTEVVGRVEGGVKCISPSPDGDLLGVITGFGQILIMTHDWDLLYEMALDDHAEDVDVHEPIISSNYSCESPISWRGDGKFFATLSKVLDSFPSQKKLKVWERDSGALHSVSESMVFVGSILDWMPSGAKIATVGDQREGKKCPSIVFFERNGLQRSSFSINEEIDAKIESLKWNCNSELLAAVVRGGNHDSIKIWFYSNNHWYLKHEIRYVKQDGVKFMWNPVKPLQLISWTFDGQLLIQNFNWITAVTDNSSAFVIDDSNILVTPLALSLIPPPMSLFTLRVPAAVRDLAFFSRNTMNSLVAHLSDGRLCVVELPALDMWDELEGTEIIVEAVSCDFRFDSLMHLVWLDSHMLLCSHSGVSQGNSAATNISGKYVHRSSSYLLEIQLSCSENHIPGSVTNSGWQAIMSNPISLEEQVIGIIADPLRRFSAYIQLDGGKIVQYMSKLGDNRLIPLQKRDDMCFSTTCPWMILAVAEDFGSRKPLLLGLDDNGRVQLGGRILCNNCSSFSCYSSAANGSTSHIILSTKQDLLFIVSIDDIQNEQLDAKYDRFLPVFKKRNEEDGRKYINIWERGAKVIGALHGDESAVVLLTTRGNLECIYPRKLVLASIINALVQRRFRDALFMIRRQRIDFNVIVDHCGWKAFLQLAPEFVKQVNNLSYITEFVCAVKNENVINTLYKDYIALPSQSSINTVESGDFSDLNKNNKVSVVLLAIRKALEEEIAECPPRELCILTTLARCDPPLLEDALKRIKVIREVELSGSDRSKLTDSPSAEECLKHLLWLSDPDAVYEAALGLYDVNLAAIVALNSQKDPKEFLPFLQGLESMPPILMKYNIDLRLQRFENALRHIISAGDGYYPDCMKLMESHPELFPVGLKLISDPVERSQILEAWGDHLSFIKCFEDAAITYLRCSCMEKALKAYRSCGNWSGVLTVAGLLQLGKEEVMQLAQELCEELQALGKPADAAKIALDYCGDVKASIGLLVSAREWDEALRIAFLYQRDDLISEVKITSLECANALVGEYEEGLEKVGKYVTRYLAVRQRRLLLAAKLKSDERSINEFDDETASEASSNLSGMSAYTTGTRRGSAASISSTSTKGRGRQRNKGKIRAGSPGEEMALLEHLRGMTLASGAKTELRSLLVSLVMLGMDDIARKLQKACEIFQLSQIAAVKLAEDASLTESMDDQVYSMEHYVQKVRKEMQDLDAFSWQCKVLV
ncbi:OLC1v1027682C4 [Oldenlandia corymbosa var. corymbosa]|uniref:Elongator complex protein 1 n=1 Tax=Oldenlandia corymbosa var. corymbosa TaxID=529605 RepID=A0AAV1CAJ7_OLDCO|nr:OLC1v1027682C4 [Oldenlandia corymbosa var. corymbosa]